MLGDCQVMLTMLLCGESEMTASLAADGITELAKSLSEIASRQIAGKPHTAMTSSWTW